MRGLTPLLRPSESNKHFSPVFECSGDSQAKDENKLKAAQELNDNFNVLIAHPQYQIILDHAMRVFLKLL